MPERTPAHVVLDSSFLVAFYNPRDVHHERARGAMEHLASGLWGLALLPEYVFLEVVTVLAARSSHEMAVQAGVVLLGNREIEFVPCSQVFTATFDTFRRQDALSFADAAIVAIAERRGASVLTFDTDFEPIEGLKVLP